VTIDKVAFFFNAFNHILANVNNLGLPDEHKDTYI